MTKPLRLAAVYLIVVISATAALVGARPAAAVTRNVCPSGGIPAPGTTITGGLEVDDICFLTDVTVNGGITTDPLPADFSRIPWLEV